MTLRWSISSTISAIFSRSAKGADGRAAHIIEAIGLNRSELTSEEQSRLESLICQYQNLPLSRLTWGLQSSSLTVYTLVTTLLSPSHCVAPIVEPGEAGKMTLIVENHSHQPIDLESSYVLGCLHPVERVLPNDRAQEKKRKIVQYAFTDWGMPPHRPFAVRAAQ